MILNGNATIFYQSGRTAMWIAIEKCGMISLQDKQRSDSDGVICFLDE